MINVTESFVLGSSGKQTSLEMSLLQQTPLLVVPACNASATTTPKIIAHSYTHSCLLCCFSSEA